MTSKAAFVQADIDRIFRAAAKHGYAVQIDIRRLTVTAFPEREDAEALDKRPRRPSILTEGDLPPDGKENF